MKFEERFRIFRIFIQTKHGLLNVDGLLSSVAVNLIEPGLFAVDSLKIKMVPKFCETFSSIWLN